MARYVIDAPTLLHIVEHGLEVHAEHRLVAPAALRSHALQLLLEAVQRGEPTDELALQRHERLTEVKVRLLGDRVSRRTAWRLAREHGWPELSDAEYLAVTLLQADALITVDAAFADRARPIVEVAPPSALTRPSRPAR